MTYTPRKTSPAIGDKRWTQTPHGYNAQIIGSPTAWAYSVLSNCTGYVHGRWMELGNTTTEYNLSSGHAKSYWNHNDGYKRGQTPQLGAVLCMGGGENGHVAIVEEILDNGDIMCSESNWGSSIFEYVRRYKSLGYRRSSSSASIGGFQGFIYHPNISPEPPTPPHGGGINLLMLISQQNKRKRGKHYGVKYI